MKPKQKSILFKIWKYPKLSETFITAQIITAIKCGYKVNILVDELCDINESKQSGLFEQYDLKDKIILEDYRIPIIKVRRYLKGLILLILNFTDLKKLVKYLKSQREIEIRHIYQFHFYKKLNGFDLIHVQYGTNSRPLDTFKSIGLIPSKLIVSFHGHDLHFPINGKILNNGYYDSLFSIADLLVVNTSYLKKKILNLNAPSGKISTIPVSVDTDFFKPQKKKFLNNNQNIHLISVGRLERLKGHDYGLKCVRRLKEKGYSIKYTIVGEGNHQPELKNLVIKYNLDKNINFAGRRSQNEIRDLLWESDIFLMTSITDPVYGAESQGLVTAEAQACGLPVIGFDSGGVKYTILHGETGFVVPEGDVEAMVEKIEILITNPDLRRKLGRNARKYIQENFSTNRIDEVWIRTYNNLITQ